MSEVLLRYYAAHKYVPTENGDYLVWAKNFRGYAHWNGDGWSVDEIELWGVDILYWAESPTLNALKFNDGKEI